MYREEKNVKSSENIAKLIEKKKYLEAEKELLYTIEKNKEDYNTHFLLGNIYAVLKKNELAKKHLNISIKLNSKNKFAHYYLGLVLNELGQFENSKDSFENALKIDPDYLYANLSIALYYEKLNKFEKAKVYFEKTLTINKDFVLGNQMYANFLLKMGEITKGQYHTYKYAGVIRFKENIIKKPKIKRISISKDKNFIGCWNINNDDLCRKVIDFFEKRKDLQKLGEVSFSGKNINVKKSVDISIHPKNLTQDGYEDLKFYLDILHECFEDYKNQWTFLKDHISTLDIPSFNIQKYDIGGHFNKMHCERANLQSMHRVFAWMTYLNDVEDGGDTYFDHFDLRIKPSTGKTLIWPAEWTHAHRGEILNKGNKYIITGWMHFPFTFNR